jgi:DnaK suppressor protein
MSKTAKQAAVKKAATLMKKAKKAPTKMGAASKSKKAAPAKKPATKPLKPAAKGKAPEKSAKAPEKHAKAAAPAPAKELKKSVAPAPAPAKKDDKKGAPAAGKLLAKKDVQEKGPVGKKDARTGAVAGAAAKPTAQPIKVEPKIIETPQPEFVSRAPDQELFSPDEIEQFRTLLLAERGKILTKARRAMEEGNIQIDRDDMFDEVDQASAMIDQNLTFRLLDRDRKLLQEIDHAIAKLDTGDFGYCEGTGEPIPKRRLELRPWCRHSVKYKEKLERMKKSGRGVADEDEV